MDIALQRREPQLDAKQPIPTTIPERARQCLAGEGIDTCAAWLALKRKRFLIFGITRKMAELVNEAVAEVLRT